jgi:hypothetical protein
VSVLAALRSEQPSDDLAGAIKGVIELGDHRARAAGTDPEILDSAQPAISVARASERRIT